MSHNSQKYLSLAFLGPQTVDNLLTDTPSSSLSSIPTIKGFYFFIFFYSTVCKITLFISGWPAIYCLVLIGSKYYDPGLQKVLCESVSRNHIQRDSTISFPYLTRVRSGFYDLNLTFHFLINRTPLLVICLLEYEQVSLGSLSVHF